MSQALLMFCHNGVELEVAFDLDGTPRDWEEIEDALREMVTAAMEDGLLPPRPAPSLALPKQPSIPS